MNPCIGDRPLDPPEDDECEECPCGSHVYTTHGSCMHCSYHLDDSDPGEPNPYPED